MERRAFCDDICMMFSFVLFFFQAEDGIRDSSVTGVQTCALLFSSRRRHTRFKCDWSSDVCSSDLFLVASFNALLAWTISSHSRKLGRRIGYATAAVAILLSVALAGPRLVPKPQAHHYARAVQLNFPEVASYPAGWFQAHSAELAEISRISLAPSAEKPGLLICPET